jgi:tetratricopeptide (TPR) repeat protein
MEREIDNLRAALRWASAHDPELELRLTAAMLNFWSTRRYVGEGRAWLEHLLPRLKAAVPQFQPQQMAQYAEIHFMLALFCWLQGDYALAKTRWEESVVLARELRDWQKLGSSLNFLALTFYNWGDAAAAYAPAAESVALLREAGESRQLAISLITLGRITCAQGDYATAHTLHEEALGIFRKLGNVWGGNFGLLRSSEVLFAQGDDVGARALLEAVLPTFHEEDHTWFVAQTLLALGKVQWRQGDKAQAIVRWKETAVLAREVGAQDLLAGALLMSGLAAQENGELQRAKAFFLESLALFQAVGHPAGIAYVVSGLASIMDQVEQAARLLGTATTVLNTSRMPMNQIEYACHERSVAATRAQLDEAVFAAAWAGGQAMPLEQAVAYALALV